MPGLTPNPADPTEKPWTVYSCPWDLDGAHWEEGSLVGLFYAATAEEAIAFACEDEPLLTLYRPDCLDVHLAWLVPRTPWEEQKRILEIPDPPF